MLGEKPVGLKSGRRERTQPTGRMRCLWGGPLRKSPMSFPAELVLAARRLRRHPGFTMASLTTLGVGMGASLAMFAVVYGVVLNPLPYPESGRLVQLDHRAPGIGNDGGLGMAQGLYLLYRESSRTLADLAIYSDDDVTLTGKGEPRRLVATVTTHELATVLRARPAMGRFLIEADGQPGATPAVVLSHALWASVFGANPAVVGRSILLNGIGVQVVGVMPASFGFPSRRTDLWLAQPVNPATDSFGSFTPAGIARLAPGVDVRTASDELQRLVPRLVERFPGSTSRQLVQDARLSPLVVPLRQAIVGDVATTLWVLLGTVGLVLLIAGVNVINLLVVRMEGRQREMAVRTALGAGPRSLAAYALAEAAWLATASGAIGVALAAAALGLVRRFGPAGLPRLEEIRLTPVVWGAAVALSAVAGMVLGLIPLVARRERNLGAALKHGTRTTPSRARFRARNALIVSQTAFALVLIVAAGLMARSFRHLTHVDTGFDADGVLTFQISLPATNYPTRQRVVAFHDAFLARLRGIRGVQRAGATTCLPLCGSWAGSAWAREDRRPRPGEIPPIVATRRVSEDYLETMRVRLVRGRTIERQDHEQLTGAAVLNRTAVAKLFPDEDPLGKRIYYGASTNDPPWYQVVGIVENTPVRSLTGEPTPTVYLPLLHRDAGGPSPQLLSYAVRSSLPPLRLVALVRAELGQLDPSLPMAEVRTMRGVVRAATARMAFSMVLLGLAASMALFLGMVGIYSVIAYMVAQRAPEFGIRLAIGARREDITRMVLRQGSVMVGLGIGVGILGALGLTRFMRAMVFGVSTADPVTYAVVTGVLGAVAFLAIYGPAQRAAATAPMESLRSE
jgi:putative ABC transport system permease protein